MGASCGREYGNGSFCREFHVYLQPKYNPVTEELSGAEALVRWINQEDGFILPGRFIPILRRFAKPMPAKEYEAKMK